MFNFFRKPKMPNQAWVSETVAEGQFTPDGVELEKKLYHLMFFCDNRMEGFPLHADISPMASDRLYRGFTQSPFTMFKKRLANRSFPIPLPKKFHGVQQRPIKGEIYLIRTQKIFDLDKTYGNGVQFTREKVWINIPVLRTEQSTVHPHRTREVYDVNAFHIWMYVAAEGYWDDLLDNSGLFGTVKAYSPTEYYADEYYAWSRSEIKEPGPWPVAQPEDDLLNKPVQNFTPEDFAKLKRLYAAKDDVPSS